MSDELDQVALAKTAYAPVHWVAESDRAAIIRAYLDAIKPEGEPDRIAVVVGANGQAMGIRPLERYIEPTDEHWQKLESISTSVHPDITPPMTRAVYVYERTSEPLTTKGR